MATFGQAFADPLSFSPILAELPTKAVHLLISESMVPFQACTPELKNSLTSGSVHHDEEARELDPSAPISTATALHPEGTEFKAQEKKASTARGAYLRHKLLHHEFIRSRATIFPPVIISGN